MALHYRREAPVRPRFLLALTLSTVTALAVGAPLAIQATGHEASSSSAAGPGDGGDAVGYGDNVGADAIGQSRLGDGPDGIGGIAAENDSKAKAQALSPKSAAVTEPEAPDTSTTIDTTAPTSSSTVPETTTTLATTTSGSAASSTSTTSGASSSSSSSSTSSTTGSSTTSSTARGTTTSTGTGSSSTAGPTVAPTSSSAGQSTTS